MGRRRLPKSDRHDPDKKDVKDQTQDPQLPLQEGGDHRDHDPHQKHDLRMGVKEGVQSQDRFPLRIQKDLDPVFVFDISVLPLSDGYRFPLFVIVEHLPAIGSRYGVALCRCDHPSLPVQIGGPSAFLTDPVLPVICTDRLIIFIKIHVRISGIGIGPPDDGIIIGIADRLSLPVQVMHLTDPSVGPVNTVELIVSVLMLHLFFSQIVGIPFRLPERRISPVDRIISTGLFHRFSRLIIVT